MSAGSFLHRVYANLKIALLQRLQVSHYRLSVGAGCPTHSRVSNEWDLETRGLVPGAPGVAFRVDWVTL
jgi:hypothetical protein